MPVAVIGLDLAKSVFQAHCATKPAALRTVRL